jgi:NAD(P)-dependent dehydrogenase (short-subunit alcohol dehydrogenase family)
MPDNPHISQIPALAPGGVAVITGAASGIGLAAARTFAEAGLKVVMADLAGEKLQAAAAEVSRACGRPAEVLDVGVDVGVFESMEALRDRTLAEFGAPSVLMNNAGVGLNPGGVAQDLAGWRRLIDVNFWGVEHGLQAFVPAMTADDTPRLIINTGSKQGITTPPGNAAYNVSKAAVKALTEALAYELREKQSRTTAHLLIPGFTFTGMTGRAEKPAAAWTGQQVVDFMLESLARGDFYILCPDNDVDRRVDEKRMAWAIGDLIENRPALSRWHPDYKAAFERYMGED